MCNFLEYKGGFLSPPAYAPRRGLANRDWATDSKVVYRRYASLFFIAGCSSTDNELITLEVVHRYVEQMDKYYGNVCELDIIFNFQKAYFILDELLLAGEMQESSKKNVLRCISQQDSLEDMEVSFVPNESTSASPISLAVNLFWIIKVYAACFDVLKQTLCSSLTPSLIPPPCTLSRRNRANALLPQVEEDVVTKIM